MWRNLEQRDKPQVDGQPLHAIRHKMVRGSSRLPSQIPWRLGAARRPVRRDARPILRGRDHGVFQRSCAVSRPGGACGQNGDGDARGRGQPDWCLAPPRLRTRFRLRHRAGLTRPWARSAFPNAPATPRSVRYATSPPGFVLRLRTGRSWSAAASLERSKQSRGSRTSETWS
jgi:hypothetical protein